MSNHQPDKNLGYIEWKAWSRDTFGSYTAKDSTVFSCELRKAGVSLNKDSVVLEVGFGNGSFAGWIRQQTPLPHYVGTENNPELIARAQQIGIEAYPATFDLDTLAKGRSFDLIVIFDVLEHLEKPEILQILHSVRRCLSSTGRVIIRVPSGDSPFSGHLMYGDITHKTNLGSFAFYQLATLTGLEVLSVRNAAFPILGMGALAAIRRFAIFPVRKICNGIIRAVYFANEPAVMASNLVAVLRLAPSAVSTSADSH